MSPANKVISNLTSREDVSVVYLLVTKVELGEQLVTTYTKSTKKKKTPKPQRELHTTFESNIVNNGGETLTWPATYTELTAASKDDGSTADSPEDTARAIYNSLGIEDNTEILLLIGWCTDKQRRLLTLFPESLTCDVIFKMNNKKRPVFHIGGKTSSNETFTGMYDMLPSQAVWVFDFVWISSYLVWQILECWCITSRSILMATIKSTTHLLPSSPISTQARSVHRLCTYHTFTQTWPQNGITTLHIKSKAGSDKGVTILDVIKFWTLMWTTDIESLKELDVSYNLLQCFLEDNDNMKCFDKMFPTNVCWVIAKNIWHHHKKFMYYQFMKGCTMMVWTSNSSEVEGGVVKHHSAGPKPNHSMEKSAESLVHLTDYRIKLKEQKAAKEADSMPMKLAPTLQPLYRFLTQHCADLVVKNWQRRSRLTVYRAAIDKFYVKEKVLKVLVKKPLANNHKEYIQCIKPRFERTHVVEQVIIVQGNLYLKCTCCEYEQCGYSCDGIFAILDNIPSHHNIAI
jgi:hypothetical protein